LFILWLKALHYYKEVFSVTTQDILTLARAGFNAQQIAALSTLAGQPSPAPATAPAQASATAPAQASATAPAQASATAPAQASATAPAPAQASDDVTAMLQKLGVLTDAIQANGLLNANQPKQQTTDDILAAIIAPPIKKE
jgi:hypothetical protein